MQLSSSKYNLSIRQAPYTQAILPSRRAKSTRRGTLEIQEIINSQRAHYFVAGRLTHLVFGLYLQPQGNSAFNTSQSIPNAWKTTPIYSGFVECSENELNTSRHKFWAATSNALNTHTVTSSRRKECVFEYYDTLSFKCSAQCCPCRLRCSLDGVLSRLALCYSPIRDTPAHTSWLRC